MLQLLSRINLIGFLIATAALLAAYFIEFYYHISPCPLCILQRIALFLCIIFLLTRCIKKITPVNLIKFAGAILLSSLAGILLAGRQVWLQHFATSSTMCLPGLTDLKQMSLFHWITQAISGDANCAIVTWQFLGLSMAAWSLLVFIFLFVLSLINFIAYFRVKNSFSSLS